MQIPLEFNVNYVRLHLPAQSAGIRTGLPAILKKGPAGRRCGTRYFEPCVANEGVANGRVPQ